MKGTIRIQFYTPSPPLPQPHFTHIYTQRTITGLWRFGGWQMRAHSSLLNQPPIKLQTEKPEPGKAAKCSKWPHTLYSIEAHRSQELYPIISTHSLKCSVSFISVCSCHWLHTWQVYYWGHKGVQCRAWRFLRKQAVKFSTILSHKLWIVRSFALIWRLGEATMSWQVYCSGVLLSCLGSVSGESSKQQYQRPVLNLEVLTDTAQNLLFIEKWLGLAFSLAWLLACALCVRYFTNSFWCFNVDRG